LLEAAVGFAVVHDGLRVLGGQFQDSFQLDHGSRVDLQFGIGTEIARQVVDDGGDFLFARLGALIHHIGDFVVPIVMAQAEPPEAAGIVAIEADFRDDFLARPIGQAFGILIVAGQAKLTHDQEQEQTQFFHLFYYALMPLWLSESDVRAVLAPAELIPAIEFALAAFSSGGVVQPVRTAFEIGERCFFALMPAFDRDHAILGAKLVSVVPPNAARGLHTHLAAISLFDPETGELAAVMDGRYITEVRTAAASAVSVRHLARRDAATLAILGSGVQARSHLAALKLVRDFTSIRAWSPTAEHLRRFVAETGPPMRAARSAEDAVRGADVVVVATNSVTPVLEAPWAGPGTHVIAIGACRPSQAEVDPALVARARLVVDSRAAALQESGDILQPIRAGLFGEDHVRAELGEVVCGQKPGRQDREEVTLFKSLGLAIEDLVAADLAWRRARQKGLGTTVKL
jgi:alanine dehydrogenase